MASPRLLMSRPDSSLSNCPSSRPMSGGCARLSVPAHPWPSSQPMSGGCARLSVHVVTASLGPNRPGRPGCGGLGREGGGSGRVTKWVHGAGGGAEVGPRLVAGSEGSAEARRWRCRAAALYLLTRPAGRRHTANAATMESIFLDTHQPHCRTDLE